ncbi:MAG: hypothetical protein ACOH2T_29375 [Pseudomonas sp.]
MSLQFVFVNPPLPPLMLQHPALRDLASTIRAIYPNAYRVGSMARLPGDKYFGDQGEGPDVASWMFGRYCDLPSIDRVMVVSQVVEAVPRQIYTTAFTADEAARNAVLSDPPDAVSAACGLYWYISDLIEVISSVSTAAIMLDLPGAQE